MSGIVSARLGGICAVLFVVLMVVGVTLGFDQPDNDAADQEWIDYVNDDGKLVMNLIGGYLLVIAGVLFLVFLVAMYQRMRAAESSDSGLPLVMLVTGVGWALGLMIGAIIIEVIPGGTKLGSATPATPETARWLPQIGFAVILVAGALCAAAMSAVMSGLILRTKAMPVWLAYFGFLAALAMLFAATFFPVIIFALWVLVLGIVMATSAEPEERAVTA
jgi:drug/metabolite transporter (DMT)-like permease